MNKEECLCPYCKNNLPFDIPEELMDELLAGRLVVFAGAGISTENPNIFKNSFYETIKAELKEESSISFPELMSRFCNSQPNGRVKLMQRIKHRFDYCHQFRELYNESVNFHQELSSFPMITDIITTNWDDFFERECNAVPMVTPKDFAFINLDDRKVFKIHGSISNYGSIVATSEDYESCYESLNSGVLGSSLKSLLVSKTVLFVGYSFRDQDFERIYNFLQSELEDVMPHSYVVTLDDEIPESINLNSTIIQTDGTFFLKTIRTHLEGIDHLIPKENIENLALTYLLVSSAQEFVINELKDIKRVNIGYCIFYQDGVKHALDYLKFHSKSGKMFDPAHLLRKIHIYEKHLRKEKLRNGNYADVAYIDGYIQGLYVPFAEKQDVEEFPSYYLYGLGEIADKNDFINQIRENRVHHKSAERYGKKYFYQFLEKDMILHHRAFL